MFFNSSLLAQGLDESIWTKDPEGWHFYKERKHKYVEPEPEPEITQKQEEEELFTEKMQKKTKRLLSKAMENPTIENIYEYLKHQKEMIDRSQEFADTWDLTIALYPDLVYPENPAHPRFRLVEWKLRDKKMAESIRRLSEKAGIFFIYSGECPYCREQAEVLAKFRQEFPDIYIKPISIDGVIFPEFPETVFDLSFAYNLGISNVPALVLYFPEKKGFLKLSEGAIDIESLTRRLVLYERLYENKNLDAFLVIYNY